MLKDLIIESMRGEGVFTFLYRANKVCGMYISLLEYFTISNNLKYWQYNLIALVKLCIISVALLHLKLVDFPFFIGACIAVTQKHQQAAAAAFQIVLTVRLHATVYLIRGNKSYFCFNFFHVASEVLFIIFPTLALMS